MRTWDFIDTIGLNTHFQQGENWALAQPALAALGIRHLRDAAPKLGQPSAYNNFAAAGLKLTATVSVGRPIPEKIADLEALETAQPGTLAAIEGPNEINNWPVTYNDLTGRPAAIAFQNDLYTAVKASPVLSAVPVLLFTDSVLSAASCDYCNFHSYPGLGQPLGTSMAKMTAAAAGKLNPVVPIQLTEFGYSTLATIANGVDATTQAALLLRAWLDAVKAGVKRIFLYQFNDFYADAPGTVLGAHYGLYDMARAPKKSATMFAAIIAYLADNGATAATHADVPLKITGAPATVSTLALTNSAGETILAVWRPVNLWASGAPVVTPSQSFKIKCATKPSKLAWWDPLTDQSATLPIYAGAYTLPLAAGPIFLRATP